MPGLKVMTVLRPQDIGKDFPDFSGGVGTPYILFNSNTGEKWLLFTGWKDPVGSKREAAVTLIEKDMSVDTRKIRKILSSDLIAGSYTMNAVRGVYNPVRDEFIVTVTQDDSAYVFWFDSDWNRIGFQRIMGGVYDHGVAFKPLGAYGYLHDALAAVPAGARIKLLGLRGVDEHGGVRVEDYGIAAWHGVGNAVLDLLLMPRVSVIAESDEFGKWVLKSFIGPPPNDVKGLCENGVASIGLLEGDLLPLLPVDDILIQVGHPHYTTEPDGYPKLFCASFRDTWSTRRETGKEGYTHEICTVQVDTRIFDPRSYGVLKDRVFIPGERSLPSKWYWVGPAEKITLVATSAVEGGMVVELSESCSLTSIEDSLRHRLEASSGCNKLVVENPAPFIRIESVEPAVSPIWMLARY